MWEVEGDAGADAELRTEQEAVLELLELAARKQAAYQEFLGRDDIRWDFLTGEEPDIRRLADSVGSFLRQQKIVIVSKIDEIVINAGTAAEIDLTVGMAGTRGSFGLDADAYRFNLELEYDGNRWLLIGALWGQLAGELH